VARRLKDFIFIPGEVRSKKNSRRYVGKGKLIASKACLEYYKLTAAYWEKERTNFLESIRDKEPPYRIEFAFVRQTKRKFDYMNMGQTVTDLMVSYGWLKDDDWKNIIPSFAPVTFDKNHFGVIIKTI